MAPSETAPPEGRLRELALLFLRLGATAFGGPAAHVALMEHEIVSRRGWLTRERFLDLLGATNLIPGPNSTELAIHIGHARAGWPGLVVAGASFIAPAVAIVTACAWAYVRFGAVPELAGFLYGVKPVVIAVVVQALWRLSHTAIRSARLGALALAAAAANALGVGEIAVLAASALVAVAVEVGAARAARGFAPLAGGSALAASASSAFGLWPLFLFFAKVGSVLFGSGYVLLAFLRTGLVAERGWLSESQLLDAIAVGQVTPGPLFTTATFIGYLLGGTPGAAVATLGIFLPAFVFVAASAPFLPRLRASPVAGALLDGVNAASLALMAVVTAHLAHAALVDVPTVALAAAAGAALLARPRWNSAWLVLAGGALGLALRT